MKIGIVLAAAVALGVRGEQDAPGFPRGKLQHRQSRIVVPGTGPEDDHARARQ